MANRLLWRKRFEEAFGFMPPSSERARFLRNVSHENGRLVWNGDPNGFEIDGVYFDPTEVAEAMMLGSVRMPQYLPPSPISAHRSMDRAPTF